MTQVVPSPPRLRTPAAPPPPAPGERPRGRRWLFGFWAAVLVAFLAPSPGKMTFDTKLPVVLDPFGFLAGLGSLWHDRAGFGGITDQYVGYAFPMLPYYALAHLLHVPVWLAERLWMSLIVTVAFWGALRLAERLRAGSPATRLLGAAGYALWPVFTIVVGSTSAAALPGALLPWVVLPLTNPASRPRIAAARSALLVPCMGGVNAASTLASLLPVALYLLSRPAGRRQRALLGWWIPGVLLATLWWVVPLLLLGAYGRTSCRTSSRPTPPPPPWPPPRRCAARATGWRTCTSARRGCPAAGPWPPPPPPSSARGSPPRWVLPGSRGAICPSGAGCCSWCSPSR
jgi:arabinofuranan 3-O-arabinosyltransferase